MINHEIKVNISYVTLDDSRNHNAFSDSLIKDFINILEQIDKNKEIRIVVLSAVGKNFSSGADLNWMQSMSKSSKEVNKKDALSLATLLNKLNQLSKPIIALVQGKTFGGALGILACCDIVVAEATASFCFSEVKLGLIPATIAPYIVQAIGPRASRYYFMTAKPFDAETAERMGFIHITCPAGELNNTAEKLITQLLKNGPKAMIAAKQLIHDIAPITPVLIKKTAKILAELRVSEEAQEGLAAFFAKRQPNWAQEQD